MQFADFAQVNGLVVRDLHASDRIRRCGTEQHPRSTNGAYFFDGRRGWVMCWDGPAEILWWNDPQAKEWTEADKAQWRARRDAHRQEQLRRNAWAAKVAQERLGASEIGESPYLAYKGLKGTPAHVCDGLTIVPMRDADTNALTGAQYIEWLPEVREYEKKFQPGMRARRSVYRIGRGRELAFCEGWATGLSIAAACKQMSLPVQVVCTFSAHNLAEVARNTKGRAYVLADHDASGAGQAAAESSGLPWGMPDDVGMDCNDLHAQVGLLALGKLIREVRRR